MTGGDRQEAALPGGGLSWSWDLDLDALMAAVGQLVPASVQGSGSGASDPCDDQPGLPADGQSGGQDGDDPAEAEFAEYLAAVDAGRSQVVPLPEVAGVLAESLPTSPDLAGWLGSAPAVSADERALVGLASSYRRLASWAQAGELEAVAQLASRSAAADEGIGVDGEGRPGRVPADACGQVSLGLTLSQGSASWWADLAVTLGWRLRATGAALRAGVIDLSRARAIAEATSVLDEESARLVESRVLGKAGLQTLGGLRAALRRAVIAVNPAGAERRREEAERRARVALYPDAEGTAGLAGYSLPGVRAAAAMARITALAQAMKASGAGGGIDLLRSKVFLGLLLGTLPYIPPAPGGPPDDCCPPGDDDPPDDGPSGDDQPGDGQPGADESGSDLPGDAGVPGDGAPSEAPAPGAPASGAPASGGPVSGAPAADVPAPGFPSSGALGGAFGGRAPWPQVNAFVAPGPAAMGYLAPAGGPFLDLSVPWSTLTGDGTEPGQLSRLGAITPAQASYLAELAASDPGASWRVIVIGADGQARAVAKARSRAGPAAGPGPPAALTGRRADLCGLIRLVTVTITQDELGLPPGGLAAPVGDGEGDVDGDRPAGRRLVARLGQVLDAARLAAGSAAGQDAADAAAGGCAHLKATAAYRPSPRLSEYISVRDVTCRFPTCRQPAARCDQDHTRPYDQGGKTCCCNMGELCRYHHQLKQHYRWHLTQPAPGHFAWTTPTGRTYSTAPDAHAA